MIPKDAVAVVMAGGKSSRMQEDKALLPFGKVDTLAQYQLLRLSSFFSKVYLSSKSNKFNFLANLVEDNYPTSSPLVALISIFENLQLDEFFILSVDAPFVGKEVIEALYEAVEGKYDVIVAKSSGGLEPLCAIYKRSFLEEAYVALKENNHRLQELFTKLSVKEVYFDNEEYFMNLNYPHEYKEAKKRVK